MQRSRIIYPEYPVEGKIAFMQWYHSQCASLEGCMVELQRRLASIISQHDLHPTIKSRVKSFHSYYEKIQHRARSIGMESGRVEINDAVGIRIICPFIEDLHQIEHILQEHFKVHEVERKGSEYSFQEFGYESTHYLLHVPQQILGEYNLEPDLLFEVQLRTILQDAWAEVEHELIYKAEFTPFDQPLKRKLAALNANLSLADIIFQEIRDYQRQLHQQMDRRRESFMARLHAVLDAEMDEYLQDSRPGSVFNGMPVEPPDPVFEGGVDGFSPAENIDAFLLRALYAHNAGRYDDSVALYSSILSGSPEGFVRALIYIHRGMAQFAQRKYDCAVDDFFQALEIDNTNGKAYYYRGMAYYMLDNLEAAVHDLDTALDLGYREFDSLFSRALVYFRLGDMTSALADCDMALEIDEDSRSVRRLRTRILQKIGV
ncbi:MAG: (p)ppGpp synthetase [Spirochaetaceae bacterium]|nr:MAG: (p)ppGpp synthetase [Spirochaetaceae bacterium]